MNAPFMLSGPSGVGKSYLERYLIQNHNFQLFISTVTRPPRPGEQDGIHYNFISEQEYKKREAEGKFLTSIYILNAWRGFEKGAIDQIIAQGKIPISVVVPQVVIQIIKHYPSAKAVYLMPHSDQLLLNRMQHRGDSPQAIQTRLHQSHEEREFYKKNAKQYYTQELPITENNFQDTVKTILTLTR